MAATNRQRDFDTGRVEVNLVPERYFVSADHYAELFELACDRAAEILYGADLGFTAEADRGLADEVRRVVLAVFDTVGLWPRTGGLGT